MKKNDSFSNMDSGDDSTQFLLSFELLTLLQWLLEHETDKLQKIVEKALASGLKKELRRSDYMDSANNSQQITEEARYNVVEFFETLESILSNAINKDALKSASEKNLLPTIDQIDSTVCDDQTLRGGIEKAASKLQENPSQNPQQVLFEELLRSWKPGKKEVAN